MSKGKDIAVAPKKPSHVEIAKCSVCGQDVGDEPSKAPKWHAACETAQPDVIAKVKARA